MKKTLTIAITLAVLVGLLLALGCQSPAAKAQKMFNEGKYEEIITLYANDPNMSAIVGQAKEKIAEKWVTEGKYDSVLAIYPETAAAKEAMNKKAEQLFMAGNYQEVVDKYMDTPWGAQAKALTND
jgi:hypothetical protein